MPSRRTLLLTSVVAVGALFLLAACLSEPTSPDPSALEPSVLDSFTPTGLVGGTLGDSGADFTGITNWINSDPLTIAELQGKVVLVDFWAYTCVNCIRTMPFLRDWQAKYADKGLVKQVPDNEGRGRNNALQGKPPLEGIMNSNAADPKGLWPLGYISA